MHPEARAWVAQWVPDRPVSVLECGGRNINGGVRDLFTATRYVSVDLEPGPEVDVVGDFAEHAGDLVDVVVCCEVAEHCEHWPALLVAAVRNLTSGGLLVFTAAGPGRAPHSAVDGGDVRPGEWYRNIDPDLLGERLASMFSRSQVDVLGPDVRAVAWR